MDTPDAPGSGGSAREYLGMGILIGGALFFRWLFLGCRLVLTDDELHYAESLHRFLRGRFLEGFSDYWSFFYPFVAIPFGAVARDAETGLRIVSIVSGAALIIPSVLIARRLWGNRAGLFAGVLLVLHPNLMAFSTAALTESLFSFLLLSAAYLLIRGMAGGSISVFGGAGVLLGLAYLTRQEAAFIAVVFLAVVAFGGGAPGLAGAAALRARRAAVMAVLFVLVSAPYLVLVHSKTGTWTGGSKASVNLSSPAIWKDDLERERFVYSLNDPGTARRIDEEARRSALKVAWRERDPIARHYFQKLSGGAGLLPMLLSTPFLLLLVPLGIFGRRWDPRTRGAESLLLMLGIFPFALYSVFKVELRYLIPYLPIYLLWGGSGCEILMRWLRENVSPRSIVAWGVLVVVFASLVPYDFQKYRSTASWQPAEWRTIGRWIRDHGGEGARILSEPGCSVSYYAGNPLATFIPWTDVPGLIKFARYHRFEYLLVADRYILDRRPTLDGILTNPPRGDLEEVHRFSGSRGTEYTLYRIKSST